MGNAAERVSTEKKVNEPNVLLQEFLIYIFILATLKLMIMNRKIKQ